MGTRGGAGQELYRQIAKKGREAAKERPAQVGNPEKLNLQREAEQRGVAGGAKNGPTSARGATRVSGSSSKKKDRV